MIDFKEIKDGDAWEAFCRDYLIAKGLTIEVPPGRGPDGGRDLLVKEQLKGHLVSRPFTWLVSCKHYAGSNSAIGTEIETNIIDRLSHHIADGFIGFYSTVASAALITRFKELRDQKKISAFEIFDAARIENGFHDVGLSGVLLQHMPNSHTSLRPIHPLIGDYVPLECEICASDLLKSSLHKKSAGAILFGDKDGRIETVHFVCKGSCDSRMTARLNRAGYMDAWDDIDDYCNPLIYLRRLTGYTNQMRGSPESYSEAAHDKMIKLYLAVSQRTLRQTNEEDRKEFMEARQVEDMGF